MLNYEDYYINQTAQFDTWDNEVHKESCIYFSTIQEKEYLWYYNNCEDAVNKAKSIWYTTADWCAYCCPSCHTS